MRKFTKLLIAGFALLLCQIAISAQTTGSINGSANDSNGAAVVGATVKLANTGTGAARTAVTGDKGEYSFSQLAPGSYTVTVEGKGFKKTVASDILVEVSKIAEVTVVLQVGLASETVTVTGAQEVINTSSPSLTNVINTRQIRDLPLPSRNPMDLAALQAGIAVSGSDTRNASVAGLRGNATNITQDGINAMDNFVKTGSFFAISAPSLNSIDEFSITTGTVGPDAGRGAAQVNMVTKSGTNAFHGSAFYLTNNSALQGNAWFNNFNGPRADGTAVTLRPDIHQHFFGVTFGGPMYLPSFGKNGPHIYKGQDKSFFFFSYEGFREKFGVTRNRTVLSPEARTGLFRYIGAAGTPGAGVLQTVNLLPLGNFHTLNPITQAQLNAMPAPNNTLVGDGLNTVGATFNVTGADPNNKWVFRIDQQIAKSAKYGTHKAEFVYNRAHFILKPDTFNGLEAPFPGGINAFQESTRSLYTFALHSDFGSFTNVFRYGNQHAPVGFIRDAPPTAAFVSLAAPTTNFDNQFMSQGRNTKINQFSDNFVMPKGSHIISAGADLQRAYAFTFNDAGINTTVTLSGTSAANPSGLLQASFPNIDATTFARAVPIYADLVGLLGSASATFNVKTATSGFVQGFTRERIFAQNDLALFASDQWRFKNNVTLSYGVRWEYEGVPSVPNGLAIQPKASDLFGISGFGNLFKPTAPAGPPPGVASQQLVSGKTGIGLYKKDWNNFAPFVGLAYSPNFEKGIGHVLFGSPNSSSIRMGYSISYLQDGFTVVSNALGTGTTNPGLIQASANTTPTGILTAAGVPLPALTFQLPLTDKQNFDINPGNGLWAFDPNLRTPYVQQWNIGYEREIFKNAAIEIRYTGNHSVKLYRAVDYNEVNIFENGFLGEFLNAQKNLAARGGASFAPDGTVGLAACPTCVALPNIGKFFTGLSLGTGFSSSAFISNLNLNNVGAMASTLAFSNTYKANRQSAAIGLPGNFFVANPNAAFARLLSNDAMSNYHSLQLEFRKRFSNGLQFQADYTWSRAMTNAADNQAAQSDLANYRTLRNPRLDYRASNNNQPWRFVANGIYELPFGKGRAYWNSPGIVNQLIGGWSVGTIVSYQSGQPFNFLATRSTFNNITANTPAVLVGITAAELKKNLGVFKTPAGVFFINPNLLDITTNATGRVSSSRLKAGLLAAPAPGTFGNAPLNYFLRPKYFNLDLSAVKRFKVGENVTLELKSSMINALNHPNFTNGSNVFDSSTFGQITSTTGSSRIINFTGSMRF